MKKQVIDYRGEAVGIVPPQGDRLRFIAVKLHVYELDNQLFDYVDDVVVAIDGLVARRRGWAA